MCVGTCMGFGSLLLLTANRHFKDANSLMGIAWSGELSPFTTVIITGLLTYGLEAQCLFRF